MKEYEVKYKIEGYGYISVIAENEKDAMNEVNRLFRGNNPRHEENDWIDSGDLWDIDCDRTEVIDAIEEV